MPVTSASRERKILSSFRFSGKHWKLTCQTAKKLNLYYNLRIQNVVVTDLGNNVMAGFKASPAQAQYVIITARLN